MYGHTNLIVFYTNLYPSTKYYDKYSYNQILFKVGNLIDILSSLKNDAVHYFESMRAVSSVFYQQGAVHTSKRIIFDLLPSFIKLEAPSPFVVTGILCQM